MLDVRAVNTGRNTCQPVIADTGIICFCHCAPNGQETTKTGITYDRVWKRAHRSLNLSTGLCSGVTQCLAPVRHIMHVRGLDLFVGQPDMLPAVVRKAFMTWASSPLSLGISTEGMYCQPQVDDGRLRRNLTALGEEQRVLDGRMAGRESEMRRSVFSYIGRSHNID